MQRFNKHSKILLVVPVLVGLLAASQARADVGPPVKIVIPPDKMRPATSGQEYMGTIEVKVGATGQLDDFQLTGQGWRVTLLGPAGPVDVQAGTSYFVEFRGTPIDASKPLIFSVTFDGRSASKRIDLGPEFFENAGKPGTVVSLDAQGRAAPFRATHNQEPSNTARGQALHLHGRIAYLRPRTSGGPQDLEVGADGMWFEVMDEDDIFDETITSGFTDINGYFDLVVEWDDCDVTGCDDPDIYLRWETDTNIVNVQRSDVLEEDYSWSTEDSVIDDFGGSEVDFGTVMPSDLGQHPAMHIQTNVTRAYRFILDHTGVEMNEVDAQWPESDNGAFYSSFWEEIHIGPDEQWIEGTIIHEYGHHVLETYAENVSPDYCNGFCDGGGCTAGTICEDAGHCLWCPETDHDAWNEGFPNWLGSALIRSFPVTYGAQCAPTGVCILGTNNGTPCVVGGPAVCTSIAALSANDGRYTLESTSTCCQDGMTYPATITEGFTGVLLRDIEDATQDDHRGGTFNCSGPVAALECVRDAMSLGPAPILQVAIGDDPITSLEFIQRFRVRFPQYDQDLWSTATNVAAEFSFVPPTPEIVIQSPECKMNIAGQSLSLDAQGNGSALRYQWERYNVDVINDTAIGGAQCSTLTFNPLTAAHEGIYRAEVFTCDQSSSTMSQPIRVSVFPARGAGNLAYAWGRNDSGQLGLGTPQAPQNPTVPPAEIPGLADFVAVSSGLSHTLALKSDGTVMAWGANQSGQLGTGFTGGPITTPIAVLNLTDIVAISAGIYHNMALQSDGTVWTWGNGYYGTLGDGLRNATSTPYHVPNLSCVTAIATGVYSSFALKSDGTVWAWGWNYWGEIGSQAAINEIRTTPVEVLGINDATAIAAGTNHVLARRANGTLLAWGANFAGQLGNGGSQYNNQIPSEVVGVSNVVSMGAGFAHSVAIVAGGTAWGWGAGNNGQLCDTGTITIRLVPIPMNGLTSVRSMDGGYMHSVFLHDNGTVTTCGTNGYGEIGALPSSFHTNEPYFLPGIGGAKAIAAGEYSSFALPNGIAPSIRTHPRSLTVLAGQAAAFSVEAIGLLPLSYQWSRDGIDIVNGGSMSGANAATLTVNPAFGTLIGTYTVQIANANGMVESVPVTLTVTCPNGDGNCDGKIDPVDAANLAQCLNGPGRPRPAACLAPAFGNFDANNDNDVDLRDAAVVQNCFAGDDFIDPACGQQ